MKHLLHILFLLLLTLAPVGMVCAEESNIESEEFVTAADGTRYTQAQMDSLRNTEDFIKASLVVADPGEILYSILGHACIHLECSTFGLDYIFSYESENVEDKIFQFLMGDLKMGMLAMETSDFLAQYQEDGRGVREFRMNLSPTQKSNLWRVLDKHLADGHNLPYDYMERGCGRSVVTILHEALDTNTISYAPWSEKYTCQTMRELVQSAISQAKDNRLISEKNAYWNAFWMYALIGAEGDKDYSCERKIIVPNDLVEVWAHASINGNNLLSKEANVLCKAQPKDFERCWINPTTIAIMLLVLALIGWWTNWQWISWLILTVVTGMGILMTYLLLFSTLPCTTWNWLIIPFNILPAIGWYWHRYWALPYAIIIGVWIIAMVLWPHTLVATAHIILALAELIILARGGICRKQK